MRLKRCILLLAYSLLCAFPVQSQLVVVYPKVPAPYSQVFEEILKGIQAQYEGDVLLKPVNKSDSPEKVSSWVETQDTQMLVALGKRGYKVAKKVGGETAVVVGALPIKPNGVSGISLLGDPKLLFNALAQLAPNIQKVHVVYSKSSEWLINLAEQQAGFLGLELNKLMATDVKSAVETYDELLANVNTQKEAVWLPLDPVTANEQVILPNLLERSWERNLVLFSSKPAHAKRGALFSMFPDHVVLGKKLVDMVEFMHQTKQKSGVMPLRDMKLAVNLRTAAHLGFKYKNQQKNQFHLTFPR